MVNDVGYINEGEEDPTRGEDDRRVWIVILGLVAILMACICVLGLAISYFVFLDEGSSGTTGPVEPVSLDQIQNINWRWVELVRTEPAGQSLVPEPQDYLLVLQPDGQFIFRAECNVGSGMYTADGSSLTLQLGPVTMADCGPASMSDEYMGLLGSVAVFGEEEGRLVLGLSENAGRLIFDNGGASQPVVPPAAATPTPQPAQPTPTMGVLPLAIPRFPPGAGAGAEVMFDGRQSQPGSSPIVRYTWELGDGTTVEGATVSHAYGAPGVYAVTLAVVAEDGLGSSATGQIVITQDQPPQPTQPAQPTQAPQPTPTAGQGSGLVGPTWRWSELIEEGEPSIVPTSQAYILKFEADLTLQVTADCNSGTGLYAVDGDRIRLNVSGVSQADCGADSLSQQYLALLSSVDEYELDEGLLLLYPSEDADRMVFVP